MLAFILFLRETGNVLLGALLVFFVFGDIMS